MIVFLLMVSAEMCCTPGAVEGPKHALDTLAFAFLLSALSPYRAVMVVGSCFILRTRFVSSDDMMIARSELFLGVFVLVSASFPSEVLSTIGALLLLQVEKDPLDECR